MHFLYVLPYGFANESFRWKGVTINLGNNIIKYFSDMWSATVLMLEKRVYGFLFPNSGGITFSRQSNGKASNTSFYSVKFSRQQANCRKKHIGLWKPAFLYEFIYNWMTSH